MKTDNNVSPTSVVLGSQLITLGELVKEGLMSRQSAFEEIRRFESNLSEISQARQILKEATERALEGIGLGAELG